MLSLATSFGSQPVDDALRGTIGIFEMVFPGRIRAYYVEGSYADRSAVATSDIDLVIVFKDRFNDGDESSAARRLGAFCADLSTFELDLEIIDEAQTARGIFPSIKLASALLYGEDIRDQLSLPPITEWTRDRMHAAYWLIVKAFDRPTGVQYPIDYPQPLEEFYGYDQRMMLLADGSRVRCTRDLVRVTGWAATALIALKTSMYVARKRDCYQVYQQLISDEWSNLLREIYERCKSDWSYRIPEAIGDRQELRAICARTLDFENHFLRIFKDYVLAELDGDDHNARHDASWLLGQIPYHDDTIIRALHKL